MDYQCWKNDNQPLLKSLGGLYLELWKPPIDLIYLKLQVNCWISKCRELIQVANLYGDNHCKVASQETACKGSGGVRASWKPVMFACTCCDEAKTWTASNITSGWQTAVAVGYWGDSQRTQPLLSLQRIWVPNKHHSQPGPCYTILKWSNMCTVDRCLAYAHHSLADWEGPQIWTQMHYWSPSHQQSSFAQTHLTQSRPQQLHM